ncbi:MAG: hypothetical protein WCY82_01070 [Desulfotomaculaceae bacterium]
MFFSKIKRALLKYQNNIEKQNNYDFASIEIGEMKVTLARRVNIPVPHEFSVFIPRVEIRKRYYNNEGLQYEKEIIYNSLTIVHSPQRPPTEAVRIKCEGRNNNSPTR